ncbi:MAG TPA: putative quinol monooxygenase [Acetobacteraceae bacterium]|nr:putative quinol monooxygenase [Acetobacteraceae bacterium]
MQNGFSGRLAFTVSWQVREGNEAAAEAVIARFLPEARKEPGVELLTVNRGADDPRHFLFYEVFADEASFEAHQQTPHFRTLILEQAIPLLAHRERVRYVTV